MHVLINTMYGQPDHKDQSDFLYKMYPHQKQRKQYRSNERVQPSILNQTLKIIHEHAGTSAQKLYPASTFLQYILLCRLVDQNPHRPICLQHIQELKQEKEKKKKNLQSSMGQTKWYLKIFNTKASRFIYY